ncbi:conserved hypothetical protein [Ricinus communis]|uniref:Uncharacterized protein n=1 Tax=Ricinus communis TaxID=3988 RepID=B9SUM6_RICCO|nr:conserved hypothetical protein [Ricinus communis]
MTRATVLKLNGPLGGKKGAKRHFSVHRRRRSLQASQGGRTTAARRRGGRGGPASAVGGGRGVEEYWESGASRRLGGDWRRCYAWKRLGR